MKTSLLFILSLFVLCSCGMLDEKLNLAPKKEKDPFQVVWAKNTDPSYNSGNLPIALQSPFIYEDFLYLSHPEGHMAAYALENGRLLWKSNDRGNSHAAPVVYDKQLIYGTNEGRVYSRDFFTGELNFSIDLDASVESQPVVYKDRILLHLRNHKIFCLDAKTGKILWAYKRSVPNLTTLQRVSRPLVVGRKVYVGFADGYAAAFALEDGVLLWERKLASGSKFIDVDMTPIKHGDNLVIGSLAGVLHVLDPETGNIMRRLDYVASRAPFINGRGMYFGTVDGKFVQLDSSYNEVQSVDLGDYSVSSFVFWKDYLAVSNVNGEIFLLNPDNFEILKKRHLGHASSAVFSDMMVGRGLLAVFSARNRLYVFK